ncbi:MAG: glycosyl hydrolase-related protein, partial [Planctomycetota bacterium]
ERDLEYRFYQLDGQSVVLEDYLEIRPEQRARIRALVQAGRLAAGPWYVMPDEFIVSGESLVRNMQLGHRVAGEFGPPLKIGFVCDIFGHNSQLPQLFRSFGIDTAVVWRGTNFPKHPALFRWQAADGSEVLAYTFEDRGYGHWLFDVRRPALRANGKLDLKKAVEGVRALMEKEGVRTPGEAVVLFDGIDHTPADPASIPTLARARAAGLRIEHSSFPLYFAAVRNQRLRLKLFRGELREPGTVEHNTVIPGVLSSRIYLKQANARCETWLTKWAEPFGALAAWLGNDDSSPFLRRAWKHLIRNHAHDSICGCSIDQVHRDMEYRFDQSRLIAERMTHVSLRAVADRVQMPSLAGDEFAVTVFNPTSAALDEVVDVPLYFKPDTPHRYQEWFGYEPIAGFRLHDADGKEVPYQRLDVTKLVPFRTYDQRAGFLGDKRERVRAAVRLRIPAHGWTTLVCRPTKDKTRSAPGSQVLDDRTMENDYLRVRINPSGTLDLTHRDSGYVYRGLLALEDRADIGDGWYHGTAVNDEIFTSAGARAEIALVADGAALTTFRVRVTLPVPERFRFDVMRRSAVPAPLVVTHWVTLRAGARRLEVHTEVENTVRDHRVRVLCPTGLPVQTYFADSPFDVVERPIALRPDNHLIVEPELETKPQHSFTAVTDGERGFAVVSTGQPESAVRDLPDRPIGLTLLRGFAKTVGTEGEEGGQMLGTTRHDYWLVPFVGKLPAAELLWAGQQLAAGVQCIYTDAARQALAAMPKPSLPATGGWLKLGPGPFVLTACKRSEDGAALILRGFNPTDEAIRQRIEFLAPVRAAHLANLLEEPQQSLARRERAITVPVEPRQIVTIRIELE